MAGLVEGKVALVTGGGSGIGRATALIFAREGAKVAVGDWVVEGGEETVRLIRQAGGEGLFIPVDVSKSGDVEAMIKKVVETFGRLDCAYNNAGVEGASLPLANCPEENWDRTININLKGTFLCLKYEILQMLKQGGGAIVNAASIAGLVSLPGIPDYTASKFGIVGLTKSVAIDYAKAGIRANAVCPGIIRTPMMDRITGGDSQMEAVFTAAEPVSRMGNPPEVGEAVVWLCSDRASFVTGHAMSVDGGWVAQ